MPCQERGPCSSSSPVAWRVPQNRWEIKVDDLQHIAHALGGEVSGRQVLAPGPGHSSHDRSLAVRPVQNAPEGLLIYSHSGDDWRRCRDHVMSRLSTTRRGAFGVYEKRRSPEAGEPVKGRIERAVTLWRQGTDPRGTLVDSYLARIIHGGVDFLEVSGD